MSTGKENFTLEKQENGNERFPVVGVRGINFAHESPGGETNIPYNNLILPSDYASSGFSNPSYNFLAEQALNRFKGQVLITSSLGYPIQKSEYVVGATSIEFKNYVTSPDEILEVSINGAISGGQVLGDIRTYKIPGEIADTLDEFDMGIEVNINNFMFLVHRDGEQMFQADNNDSSGATGNFYILDPDNDGMGSTIKFFDPAVGNEGIMVSSIGGVIDSPSVSTFQEIDYLAGQLDVVIPTVAALAGVPESNFRAAPNNVNIAAFNNRVTAIENALNLLLEKLDADTGVNDTDYKSTLGLGS